MDKYKDQYRIPSARLQTWDYGADGVYFITICTHNRICYFGDIVSDTMQLTELGKHAQQCAIDIPAHFPFVRVDEFVIMPNHVHLLIVLHRVETQNIASAQNNAIANVETQNIASHETTQNIASHETTQNVASDKNMYNKETQNVASLRGNRFGSQSQNVASIIRGFKVGVTTFARKQGIVFDWQTRFHDRIVRDDVEYCRISEYIRNNVYRWDTDSLK